MTGKTESIKIVRALKADFKISAYVLVIIVLSIRFLENYFSKLFS